MRVVALNGSARADRGVTGRLLAALTQGLAAGDAVVETVAVAAKNIAPCRACLTCMHATPGRCAQDDDMSGIYPLLQAADMLVVATPVYTDSMTAQLKAVMDRTICAMQPFLMTDAAGRTRHPLTWRLPPWFVLLATSGFPEPATFEPLKLTLRAQAANFGSRLVAEFCLPGSLALQMEPGLLEGHLGLLSQAGEELARQGGVNPWLAARINRPAFSVDEFRRVAARYEAWCRKKLAPAP
ncbi:MAG: flavodoxin family protein [Deltaproteobacteria bacterium]|nr:flavodoxin family protein [Deltaproteobacteria bacterium]